MKNVSLRIDIAKAKDVLFSRENTIGIHSTFLVEL